MPNCSSDLSSQVRLLLVDECQDTDPVQVELIKALCGDLVQHGKLFFVGDYKQSIYGFRDSDPRLFREMQRSTPPKGQLPLSINFRSQPAILDFVNALFHDAPLAGDQDSLAYEPLVPQRPQVSPTPAVEFIWPDVDGLNKRPSRRDGRGSPARGRLDCAADSANVAKQRAIGGT